MGNPLTRLHVGDLTSAVAFRFLGLGFAWSWAWTLWGALSSLSGGSSFGIASSPAWIISTASCIAALAGFGWAFATDRLTPGSRWIVAAGLLATGSSVALGAGILLGAPAPFHFLAGAAAGFGAALLYLLWTSAYARAPQVRSEVAIPLCAAVTVLPVLVISGAIPLASWAFTAALPALSALMLLSFAKKDTAPDAPTEPSGPWAPKTALSTLGIPAAALFALYGLIGITSGSGSFVGAGRVAAFEGIFALLGTMAALGLAVNAKGLGNGGAGDVGVQDGGGVAPAVQQHRHHAGDHGLADAALAADDADDLLDAAHGVGGLQKTLGGLGSLSAVLAAGPAIVGAALRGVGHGFSRSFVIKYTR